LLSAFMASGESRRIHRFELGLEWLLDGFAAQLPR
jgi:hypothetical protein